MKKQSIVFLLGLCPLVPAVAHLAEGVVFAAAFWFLFFAGVLARFAVRSVKITYLPVLCEIGIIAAASILYYRLVSLLFPVYMLPLELYIYILAAVYVLTAAIDAYDTHSRTIEVPIWYSVVLVAAGWLREFFAFGTVSLPAPSGFLSVKLFYLTPPLRFFGSGAGMLILLGVGLWLLRKFQNSTPLFKEER